LKSDGKKPDSGQAFFQIQRFFRSGNKVSNPIKAIAQPTHNGVELV
jgi:hypothetical protein